MGTCHDHQHCINEAIHNVQQACIEAKVRLTPLREQLLRLIWRSHKPIGAYDLIDMLAKESERRVAPPTVYRTLEFLLELGLVHRINSLNAYVGCPSPNTEHPCYFLICTECHTTMECEAAIIQQEVKQLGQQKQFTIQKQWLEVLGICQECQQQKS